jgi:iron complex transport system substrate-binding protein
MRRFIGLAATLLAVVIVGCGGDSSQEIRRAPKAYEKIVSLSPGLTEIVAMQLGSGRLKGRTKSCNYPISVSSVPVVMSGFKPDIEKLASIKPDLIIYDPVLFDESDVAKLKEIGCDVFPVQANTVDVFCKSLYKLGGMVKSESNISDYVDKIEKARSFAAGNAKDPKPKVAVIMPGKGIEHYVAGVGSFQADVVKCAGGEPVGPKMDRFVPLNVELLVQQNPDIIIVAGEVASVVSDPRLQSVKALKDKRVMGVNADFMLRAGSRVDKVIESLAHYFQS